MEVNPKFSSRRKSVDDYCDANRYEIDDNLSQHDHSLIAAAAEGVHVGSLQHNFDKLIGENAELVNWGNRASNHFQNKIYQQMSIQDQTNKSKQVDGGAKTQTRNRNTLNNIHQITLIPSSPDDLKHAQTGQNRIKLSTQKASPHHSFTQIAQNRRHRSNIMLAEAKMRTSQNSQFGEDQASDFGVSQTIIFWQA